MKIDKYIDVVGKACPMPLISLRQEVRNMRPGQFVQIRGNDPIFEPSVAEFCREGGHEILETTHEGRIVTIIFRV